MSPTLKSTGVDHFGANFFFFLGGEEFTDINQILKRYGRNMGLSYAEEIVSISSAL